MFFFQKRRRRRSHIVVCSLICVLEKILCPCSFGDQQPATIATQRVEKKLHFWPCLINPNRIMRPTTTMDPAQMVAK